MNRRKEGLKIYYCGHEECEPGHFFGPATRAHYLMHFILRGKGYYQIGDDNYTVASGEAFLIKPEELTFYKADLEQPWEYVWVAFGGEEAERLLEIYQLSGKRYVCSWQDIGETTDRLLKLCRAYFDSSRSREELTGWFYLIFSAIRKEACENEKGDMGYYTEAEKYVRHNCGYDIHVNDIANYIGIDRTYLFKIFKKYAGISPKQYLTACRISTARDMLDNTPLSVTEIALSSGFHDSSVFCKNFSKEMGMSPVKYRKRNQ